MNAHETNQNETNRQGPDEHDPAQHERQDPAWPSSSPERHRGTHPVNVTHLVFGVVFATFLGIWALVTGDVVSNDDLRWLLPVPWLLAGAAGLVVATLGGPARRRARHGTTGPGTPTGR